MPQVLCFLTESCSNSVIQNVQKVIVDGEDALVGATIESSGNFSNNSSVDTLIVRINGKHNGTFDIYCNEGDICKIDCQSRHACSDLCLYCFGTCFVDCDPDNGIHCPSTECGTGYLNYSDWTTFDPTSYPSTVPSAHPTIIPTILPSIIPTYSPSTIPTNLPSMNPSSSPGNNPSYIPSYISTTISPSATTEDGVSFIQDDDIVLLSLKSESFDNDDNLFNPGFRNAIKADTKITLTNEHVTELFLEQQTSLDSFWYCFQNT